MGVVSKVHMAGVWVTLVAVLFVALVPMATMAADEDPLQDFCVADATSATTVNGKVCKPPAQVVATDFKSSLLNKAGNTNNANSATVTAANVNNFAGLNTLGISMARIDFAKGGINVPHTHPRATEILFLAEGTLYVGFVSTTNNTLFATTLNKGDVFVFPKGLVHFQLNIGNYPAMAIAALSSQNPGVQQIAPALFTPDINDQVLTKAFKITEQEVDNIQAKFRA